MTVTLGVVLPLGALLADFMIANINGFELRLSAFLGNLVLIVLIATMRTINERMVWLLLIATGYACVLGFFADSQVAFFRTFVHIENFLVLIAVVLAVSVDRIVPEIKIATNVFLTAAAAHALLLIAQFAALNVFASQALMNPFGPFTAIGPDGIVYLPTEWDTIKRPNGFFSEPSVAAWFSTSAFAIGLIAESLIGRLPVARLCLMFLGTVCTVSASGVANLVVLLCALAFLPGLQMRQANLLRAGAIILAFVAVAALAGFGIADRVSELETQGSSGYTRVSAPLRLLSESLPDYPLGYPLGQVQYLASKPYMTNASGDYSGGIHNTFLLLIFYFGVAGMVVVVGAIGLVVLSWLRGRASSIAYLALVLAFSETGAGWTHKFTVLWTLVVLSAKVIDFLQGAAVRSAPTSLDIGAANVARAPPQRSL
jgi:hypothetical protein